MRAIGLYTEVMSDAVLEGKASAPAVPIGEDEFVELDDEGKPRTRGNRGKRGAARARKPAAEAAPPRIDL